MNMRMKIMSIAILFLVFSTGAILAQTTSGSITGTVVDPQSAAVANATVTIYEEGRIIS